MTRHWAGTGSARTDGDGVGIGGLPCDAEHCAVRRARDALRTLASLRVPYPHGPILHSAADVEATWHSTAGAAARCTVDSWRCCALRGMLRSEWQHGKRSFTIRSRCVASAVQIVRQLHMQHSSYNVQAHRCEMQQRTCNDATRTADATRRFASSADKVGSVRVYSLRAVGTTHRE